MRFFPLLAVLLFPAIASAQTISKEILATAGVAQLWDDESYLQAAPLVGGGAGIQLPGGVGLEMLVERHHNDHRYVSGVRFNARVVNLDGRVMKYFSRSSVRPYVGGGIGVAYTRRADQFPDSSGLLQTTTHTSRNLALSVMGGARFQSARTFVRPEFELAAAGGIVFWRLATRVTAGFTF